MRKSNRSFYLDYNATSPLKPVVKDTILSVIDQPGNPSAVHRFGRNAKLTIETARDRLAKSVNCRPDNIIFTSGATEANNMVMNHFHSHTVLISAIEHPSILQTAPESCQVLPVSSDGVLDLDALEAALKASPAPVLVSVMAVNNETGVIQPIAKIAKIVHQYDGIYHCDAVQALGRIELDIQALGIDILSLTAHKIGGPQGVGALISKADIDLMPLLKGGGQEKYKRAGTENVSGIAGFGMASMQAVKDIDEHQKLGRWRDRIEREIADYAPEVTFYSQNTDRVANTTMFSLAGIASDTQMINLDLSGIAVSNGSACSSGRVEPSHVLRAMGASEDQAASALRISLGWATEEDDINHFIQSWKDMYDRVKSRLTNAT
jgi:cysteine desulfurase